MKKTAILLLVLLLALVCCAWSAAEESEKTEITSGDYTYIVLDDGTAEIAYYSGEAEELVIPDTLDGIKVTSIGYMAFEDCYLTSILIPESVTNIGVNPFRVCYQLTDIIVSPDHPYLETSDGVLFSKPDKRLVCYPCAFTADSYTIPDGIQIIGDHAFDSCSYMTSITIPDSVTSIGDRAFFDCLSLSGVTFSDSETSIEDWAFVAFNGITIPDTLTSIGDCAFFDCYSLTSITIPDSVTSIGEYAFSVYQDGEYIPNPGLTVTVSRGSYAEQYCKDNNLNYIYAD